MSFYSVCMRFLIVVILAFAACKAPENAQQNLPINESSVMPTEEGYTEKGAVEVHRSKLHRTKGAQLVLDGLILSSDDLIRLFAENYSDTIRQWEENNYTVEAKGRHDVYHCGSMEQCLTSGEIHFLHAIEYLRLVK